MFWKKKKKKNDFKVFAQETPWFYLSNFEVEHINHEIKLDNNFIKVFPKTTKLIQSSSQTAFKLNNELYILFSWKNKIGESCGWLNKFETEFPEFLSENHNLLTKNIGGIKETYGSPDDEEMFTSNQNFLFIPSKAKKGMDGRSDFYIETCKKEGYTPIDTNNLISFMQEANGDIILYNSNEEVLLFAHDQCYETTIAMKNQPECTFYTFSNAKTFVEFVEVIAAQWLEWIKK